MSDNTYFEGKFSFNKPLDSETKKILDLLADTRRMKRDVSGFGIEGEFYFKDDRETVIDPNTPPSPQPSVWCDWKPTDDGKALGWTGRETFQCYVEWLQYIVDRVLTPRGYTITGEVEYQGREARDYGTIKAAENSIEVRRGTGQIGHA